MVYKLYWCILKKINNNFCTKVGGLDMKRKRFMQIGALVMSVMILMSGMPVYASTDETQNVSENTTSNTTVKARLNSHFKITLPKTIDANISGGTLSDDYKVKIQGDIAGDELVSVVPDKTFQLKQAGKDAVVINVTQEVTSVDCLQIIDGATATLNGTISGTGITAGDWSGVLHFNVSMNDSVSKEDTPGLYDADGNRL